VYRELNKPHIYNMSPPDPKLAKENLQRLTTLKIWSRLMNSNTHALIVAHFSTVTYVNMGAHENKLPALYWKALFDEHTISWKQLFDDMVKADDTLGQLVDEARNSVN